MAELPEKCARCERPLRHRAHPRRLRLTQEQTPLLAGPARFATMLDTYLCSECGEHLYDVLLGEGFDPSSATQASIADHYRPKARR